MNWLTIEGNYYEIGYQVGKFWAHEFKRLEGKDYGRRFFASCREGRYRYELANGWDKVYLSLFRNVLLNFPEIIEEIAGMSNGAKDAGFETSLLDMFSLVLGETEDQRLSCSSFVVKAENKIILAHSEEESIRYPLLFSKVHLKTNGKVISFISASYPFQLFGSSVGMNKYIAFQGNSIGCKDQHKQLQKTWDQRIPKTVFSRKMLELSSINEVRKLFSSHHCTLPSHHYVLYRKEAYSVEIRPKLLLMPESPKQQLTLRKHSNRIHSHTNHFHRKGVNQGVWRWGAECQDSLDRLLLLEEQLKNNVVSKTDGCMNVLRRMQQSYPESTCASIVIKKSAKRSTLSGLYYFHDGKPIQIKPVSI